MMGNWERPEDISVHPQVGGMVHLQTPDGGCLEFTWPDAIDFASHLLTASAKAAADADADPRTFTATLRTAMRDCGTIRLVRADERERIAQAIEADLLAEYDPEGITYWAVREAVGIVRNGGRDE